MGTFRTAELAQENKELAPVERIREANFRTREAEALISREMLAKYKDQLPAGTEFPSFQVAPEAFARLEREEISRQALPENERDSVLRKRGIDTLAGAYA